MNKLVREITATLRRDFIAGLLAFVPIVTTVIGVLWVLSQLDGLILPKLYAFFGLGPPRARFVGVIVTLAVILLFGALTRSFVGRGMLALWEEVIDRIPVARSLYLVLKQFMEAIFNEKGQPRFNRAVLVEYPRRGIWSYGFITGHMGAASERLEGTPEFLKVFIPKTPNPTTGYYVLVPAEDVRDSRLTVEEAFRAIISGGIATDQDDAPGAPVRFDQDPTAKPDETRTSS